ncbi:hypothetical protein Rhe02_24810 [Rhizocola hellebori]|uniref:Uncharacterized protein n=1 Tax=Rhizocola hellebori TaxID=1392758 RepID=A0A8J3Q6Q1_9ACTN|nr:DUF6350 family protein [Rhizocola hellebori]GIH04414.1 hypothetical protein Rhe02_24810 [Rhizocola hellebori]
MTTPHDLIGPQPRPSDEELAAMPTVRIPWQRPLPRKAPRPGAPLVVAALINTGWATLISVSAMILLVLTARFTLGQKPNGAEVTVALAGWLLAHGAPLTAPIGKLAVAPLAVTLLAAWRLSRAGVHTARGIGARGSGSVLTAAYVAGAIGIVYGVIGFAVGLVVDRPGLAVTPWRAGLHLLVVGAAAAFIGSLRITGAVRTIARATPQLFRDAIRTGVVGALMVLGAGAGLCGLAVALNGSDALELFRAFPSGVAGQAGVTMVCLAFAPNFAVWASAYLLGPGFVIGSGTVVRAGGVVIGEMPPLPVLAGIPHAPLDNVLSSMLAVPLLLGSVAGFLLVRRRLRPRRTRAGDTVLPTPNWWRMLGSAAVAGPVAGLVIGAMTLAGSGRLDGGKPFPVGAVAWQTALSAAVAIGLGAVLAVAAACGRRWISDRPH